MSDPTPPLLRKGRGAPSSQLSARFGLAARVDDGDWLDARTAVDKDVGNPAETLRTTVTEERARSILTFNRSPDIPFDRSINAYRGCEHVMSSRAEGRMS